MWTFFRVIVMCLASANGFLHVDPKGTSGPTLGVVGGVNATSDKAPWQVSVVKCGANCTQADSTKDYHCCGGSLIGNKTVITAAHCCDGSNAYNMKVKYGGLDRTNLTTTSLLTKCTIHPLWNKTTVDYDCCILTLKTACVQSAMVKIIPIATKTPASGTVVSLTGWGKTSANSTLPTMLQYAQLTCINQTTCNTLWNGKITDRMICAGSKTVSGCNGDSGGPMTYNGTLCGCVSWGGAGCPPDTTVNPAVYASTTNTDVRAWIIKNTV